MDEAEKYWIKDASKMALAQYNDGHFRSLRATRNDQNEITCGGRIPSFALRVGYDVLELKIIPYKHQLAKLLVDHYHNQYGHSGIDKIVDLTRHKFWIPSVRKLAAAKFKSCIECKKVDKKLQSQLMAQLKEWRVLPSPVFYVTCIDLFGPLFIRDNVKKKLTRANPTYGKVWGVVFVCASTGCLHLDITEDYSTNSFLETLKRFTSEHGVPGTFITDRGSQLTAAQKEIMPDWSEIEKRISTSKWIFSPTAAHHFNGQAEAFVQKTKRSLATILGQQVLTFGGLSTVFRQVKNIINSRPLGAKSSSDDASNVTPLTPNHLLLAGRSNIEIPQVEPMKESKLNKRYCYIQRLIEEWWRKWYSSVFYTLLPSYRWSIQQRNIQAGDLVLVKLENVSKGTFPLGLVTKIVPSLDKLVRVVEIKMKDQKVIKRDVTKIIVIIPRDYNNFLDLDL